MTEACIGLALMTFAWIIISYSMFMGDNQIRTVMASRYAAWLRGASGSAATAAQVEDRFFFQTNLCKVEYSQGEGIGDLLSGALGGLGASASKFSADSTDNQEPYLAKVTFGVTDPNDANNPFPFNLLRTKVPFMTSSMMSNCVSVSSSCQWDGVGNTWNTPGAAFDAVMDGLKSLFGF